MSKPFTSDEPLLLGLLHQVTEAALIRGCPGIRQPLTQCHLHNRVTKKLDDREQRLNELATRLDTERGEISNATLSVQQLQADFDKNVLRVKDEETANLKKLAKVYSAMTPDGALRRRNESEVVPFVYAGAAVLTPTLFAGAPSGPFSLTLLFDRATEAGRLHGLRLEGVWMHVGTPDAVHAAEEAFLESVA